MADTLNPTENSASAPVAAAIDAAKPAVAAKATRVAKTARAAKPAAKRRGRKASAAVVSAATKLNRRTAKTARRSPATATRRSAAKTAAPRATTQIEGITSMNYDFTKPFAGLELGAFQFPGADRFQSLFGETANRGQELSAKGRNAAEQISEVAKANVEALVEAGRIAVTGAKSIGQDVLVSSRDGLEQTAQSLKTLSQADSPTEFVRLQSEMVRSSFDRMVAESSKLTEQLVKLAGDAIQPISNRASINAERANELMA